MLKSLICKYREQIIYLIFGVLTTVVDFVVYELIYTTGIFPRIILATASNVIAWTVAVIFAYLTNKPFVFKSKDWSWQVVSQEFVKFAGLRFVSLAISTLFVFIFADIIGFHNLLIKALASIFVIIFNYFASKAYVFKANKQQK